MRTIANRCVIAGIVLGSALATSPVLAQDIYNKAASPQTAPPIAPLNTGLPQLVPQPLKSSLQPLTQTTKPLPQALLKAKLPDGSPASSQSSDSGGQDAIRPIPPASQRTFPAPQSLSPYERGVAAPDSAAGIAEAAGAGLAPDRFAGAGTAGLGEPGGPAPGSAADLAANDLGGAEGAPGGPSGYGLFNIGDVNPFQSFHQVNSAAVGSSLPYHVSSLGQVTKSPVVGPNPPYGTPTRLSPPLLVSNAILKFSDNQTPQPVTRFFFGYNYFNNVNAVFNKRLDLTVANVGVNHYTFGYEKAFADDYASVGVRLPFDVLTYTSTITQKGINTTGLGDLSFYGKYVLWRSEDRNNLVSTGMLVTAPTGVKTFANSDVYHFNQTTRLQPYLGTRFNLGDKGYLLAFSAIDVPANGVDATTLFNDVQLGYFLYKSEVRGRFLSAIVPLAELHVNTPLNHRGFSYKDPYFAIDQVNMTLGTHIVNYDKYVTSIAIGAPITGPRPYNFEVLVLFNVILGRDRKAPLTAPFTPNL